MASSAKTTGLQGEQAVAEFLMRRGMTILQRNYRTRFGEIDIIAQDGECIVFVEVKSCRSTAYGEPATWVNSRKQKRMVLAAAQYLQTMQWEEQECRFDVVTVTWKQKVPEFRYIKQAFYF
jgi:putative endonuclease